jgi:putative membrane protein
LCVSTRGFFSHICAIFGRDNIIENSIKEALKMMILLFIGIAVLIYYLVNNGNVTLPGKKSAEDILKERFVKGEIDEKAYLQMKETLKG